MRSSKLNHALLPENMPQHTSGAKALVLSSC
jgi:hypothetical protein